MRRGRIGLALLLLAAPLWLVLSPHPLHLTHATFHNAVCLCPVCLVVDSIVELSEGEYC